MDGFVFGSQSEAISLSKIGFLSRFPLEADFLISLSSSFMCSGNIEVPLWRHLARSHFLPGKSEFLFSTVARCTYYIWFAGVSLYFCTVLTLLYEMARDNSCKEAVYTNK